MEERYFTDEHKKILASTNIWEDSQSEFIKKRLTTYGEFLGQDWMEVYANLDWLRARAPQDYQRSINQIQEAAEKSKAKDAEKSELVKKFEAKMLEKQRLTEEDTQRERELVMKNPSYVPIMTGNQEWYKEWSKTNLPKKEAVEGQQQQKAEETKTMDIEYTKDF